MPGYIVVFVGLSLLDPNVARCTLNTWYVSMKFSTSSFQFVAHTSTC